MITILSLFSNSGEVLYLPEFQSATVVRGEGRDEWVVRVEWSEATVSCSGSVSQYVLCMAPQTPGGQSGECMTTDQTQFDLTVTSNMRYNLTIRANACGTNITGSESDPETLRLNGKVHTSVCYCVRWWRNVFADGRRTNSYTATYSDSSGILESISLSHGEFSLEVLCTVYDSPTLHTFAPACMTMFHIFHVHTVLGEDQ